MKLSTLLVPALSLLTAVTAAIPLDVENKESIKSAAAVIAAKLRALYPTQHDWFEPGEFGKLPKGPKGEDIGYYWWEGGAAMGAWIDYWAYTGDTTYNKIVKEALLFQVGPERDYQPPKHYASLGNDDQGFWGIAVMSAAERGFPDPPEDQPQWLALAQAVFNRQASRWDDSVCGGGLRWQVMPANKGYDYKNSISNGLFFQIGARLARYTMNATYAEWAERTWDWSREIGLIADDYSIPDGAHIPECHVTSNIKWTYNAGVYIAGLANMYAYYAKKGDAEAAARWMEHTEKAVNATDQWFFAYRDQRNAHYPPNVMMESFCELKQPDMKSVCNTDQKSFKAYLSRHLAMAYHLVPSPPLRDFIMTRLKASAAAAAQSCNGGDDGNTCGLAWGDLEYDGSPYGIARGDAFVHLPQGGVGEHMAAMEVIQSLLVTEATELKDETTGTSVGDASAGSGRGLSEEDLRQTEPSTTGDKAGAGILTTLCLVGLMGLTYWLVRE